MKVVCVCTIIVFCVQLKLTFFFYNLIYTPNTATGAENAAKKKDATNRPSADRISAQDTVVENDARCLDATSRRNRPRNFASSMVGEKSANRRSARRLLGEGLYFVLR